MKPFCLGSVAVMLCLSAGSACPAFRAQPQARPVWRMRVPQVYGSVVFSADGKTLAVSEAEESKAVLRLRDARTGRARAVLRGFKLRLSALAISRDGSLVATATGINNPRYGEVASGPIQLWSGRSGKLLQTLRPRRKVNFIVYALAFSPDGRTLASGGGDTLMRLWDVASGRERRVVAFGGYVNALAFSPDGKRVAAAERAEKFHVWSVPTMKTLWRARLPRHGPYPDGLSSFAFSPDGRFLLTELSLLGCQARRRVFDFGTLIAGPDDDFRLATFTPGGSVRAVFFRQGRRRLFSIERSTFRLRYGRSIATSLERESLQFSPGARSLIGYSPSTQSLQSIALG